MSILKPIKAKNNEGYHFAYLDDKIKQEALKDYIGKIPDNLSSFRWNEEMDGILKEWYGKIPIRELKERFPALQALKCISLESKLYNVWVRIRNLPQQKVKMIRIYLDSLIP